MHDRERWACHGVARDSGDGRVVNAEWIGDYESLLASREEIWLGRDDSLVESESPAAVHQLIQRGRIRLTSLAKQVVSLNQSGGSAGPAATLLSTGRLVIVQRRVDRPIPPSRPRMRPEPPRPSPRLDSPTATSWIKFQVVHHVTGAPYSGIRLSVRIPGGHEVALRTNDAGLAGIDEISPGECDIWCPLRDARLARTAEFVGLNAPPPPPMNAGRSKRGVTSEWIAEVEAHRVKTGETLESIARSHGFSWQELAEFNWGTSNPDQINLHLRDDVGCTQKTPDGFNYRFTSEDEPGLVHIPKPWSRRGLATGRTHVIRVRIAAGFRLVLRNDLGLAIPAAEYELTLADESIRTGRLGGGGVSLIHDPPPGPVEVRYIDLDDIEAKSLAATVRKSFDDRQPREIHRLFRYPAETVQRAFKAYDEFFNDYRGGGLRADIEAEWAGDEDAMLLLYTYLAEAGLEDPGAESGSSDPAASSKVDSEARRG